jgi:hypothetical protein
VIPLSPLTSMVTRTMPHAPRPLRIQARPASSDSVHFGARRPQAAPEPPKAAFFLIDWLNTLIDNIGKWLKKTWHGVSQWFKGILPNIQPDHIQPPAPAKPVKPKDAMEYRITATHELGHAMMCMVTDADIRDIDIIGVPGRSGGFINYFQENAKTRKDYLRHILIESASHPVLERFMAPELDESKPEHSNYLFQMRGGRIGDIRNMRATLKEALALGLFPDAPGLKHVNLEPPGQGKPISKWTVEETTDALNTWHYPVVKDCLRVGNQILSRIPKEKMDAMIADLIQRKRIKGNAEIRAFFEKHLGPDFDWQSVRQIARDFLTPPVERPRAA